MLLCRLRSSSDVARNSAFHETIYNGPHVPPGIPSHNTTAYSATASAPSTSEDRVHRLTDTPRFPPGLPIPPYLAVPSFAPAGVTQFLPSQESVPSAPSGSVELGRLNRHPAPAPTPPRPSIHVSPPPSQTTQASPLHVNGHGTPFHTPGPTHRHVNQDGTGHAPVHAVVQPGTNISGPPHFTLAEPAVITSNDLLSSSGGVPDAGYGSLMPAFGNVVPDTQSVIPTSRLTDWGPEVATLNDTRAATPLFLPRSPPTTQPTPAGLFDNCELMEDQQNPGYQRSWHPDHFYETQDDEAGVGWGGSGSSSSRSTDDSGESTGTSAAQNLTTF
ncbi:hypothetical protein B0H16DRAFT_326424 [Mycena metata]|uniref:Uncharacterized protein n=1 Tax=Mycena metata TaxID=1033252 RepID=A0AAD7HMR9_9AGAR|nr:hypothetical protein B0H16DRAFT_326424 [Mycena metata]